VEAAAATLKAAQDRGHAILSEIKSPEIELPEAEPPDDALEPLFTTDDWFADATQKLIDHKLLNGGSNC
jgi:hypothetical protein